MIAGLPRTSKHTAAIKTVITVLMFRFIVCQILSFNRPATSSVDFSLAKRRFSRTRSKITILSLIEYPIVVKIAAINGRFTSKRKIAKKLITTNASCRIAMIEAIANRHSNRMVTYKQIARLAAPIAKSALFFCSIAISGVTVFTSCETSLP